MNMNISEFTEWKYLANRNYMESMDSSLKFMIRILWQIQIELFVEF